MNTRNHPSHLDRRTFLKGVGVSLGLPLMDSLASAAAAPAKPPVRMAFMYMPHGVIMDQFWPKTQARPRLSACYSVSSCRRKAR